MCAALCPGCFKGFNELELRIPGHFIVYFALGLDLVAKQEGDKQSPEDLRQRLIKYSCRMVGYLLLVLLLRLLTRPAQ